ncbi:MAG: AsmA family protein [Gemmatimonadales bacterium]
MGEPQRASSRRKRLWLWIAIIVAILIAVGVIAERVIAGQAKPEALEARINRSLTSSSDGLYRVSVGTSSLDLFGGRFVATDVQLHLDSARLAELRSNKTAPRDLYTVRIPQLEVTGIRLGALLRRSIDAGHVTLTEPEVAISLDRHIPTKEGAGPALPHQALQQLETAVSIGQLNVAQGQLVYRERADDGARYGRFEFADIELGIRNITNQRERATEHATIDLAFAAAGKGQLRTKMQYDLFAPGLNMSYEGGIGSFDASMLNPLTVDLEGVRITQGQVDTLWFRVDVEDDVATGRLQARYRELRIQTLDKVTRDRSLGDHIQSFISNSFKIRVDNPQPGEPIKTAFIKLERDEDMPLLKFLWHTLRAGVAETVGF